LTEGLEENFETLLPMGSKETKAKLGKSIFNNYGRGVATCRDAWAYNFNCNLVSKNIARMIETYNEHVTKLSKLSTKPNIDDFVVNDDSKISWSNGLKNCLKRHLILEYDENKLRDSLYRPFTKKCIYFDHYLTESLYQMPLIFPNLSSQNQNRIICIPNIGGRSSFCSFCANNIIDLNFTSIDPVQCFPFYTYDEDGANRRENLTDWAWQEIRTHYRDDAIAKWDIFHYVYALLHHPAYREKYAANLRRELPRISFAPDFWGFAWAGARLAELHVHYEQQPEYPLKWVEKPGEPLNWRVDKMKFTPDKTGLIYNNFLTLEGIPTQVFNYKLGNRSALEWVIDQYKVSTDRRSGITNDPNRADDPQYIVRLIGQVITVSLETLAIIKALPAAE
jgi:predicted helicase